MDYLVVGAGYAGSVCARILAEQSGTLFRKRGNSSRWVRKNKKSI